MRAARPQAAPRPLAPARARWSRSRSSSPAASRLARHVAEHARSRCDETARAYYDRYRFADVFAHVEARARAPGRAHRRDPRRAPRRDARRRIATSSTCPASTSPPSAQLVSLPERGEPELNDLFLRAGRSPSRAAATRWSCREAFAEAHGLGRGDHAARGRSTAAGASSRSSASRSRRSTSTRSAGRRSCPTTSASASSGWAARRSRPPSTWRAPSTTSRSRLLRGDATSALVIDRLDTLLDALRRPRRLRARGPALELVPHERDRAAATLARCCPTIFLARRGLPPNMVLARLIAMERSRSPLLKAFGYRERDDRAGTT